MTTTMMIEASSPLAAMQPPSFFGHCGYRPSGTTGYGSFGPATFTAGSFNFKDLSMKRSHGDYFSITGPVRGSSPTASLAADLSQNFHIDQSPQLPTPRRSLFVGNTLYRTAVTTPPVPSSPVTFADHMDMSPLPHKAPFSSSLAISLPSPSPHGIFNDSPIEFTDSPVDFTSPIEAPLALQLPTERKRPGMMRPSLSRAKGFSTTSIPQRPSPESQLPPFKFGCGVTRSNPSSSLALSEIFEESPVLDRSVSRLNGPAMPPPRIRQPFTLGTSSRNVSPGHHIRKISNPLQRPRKQFRRSLSMFGHPDDVMKQEKEAISPVPLMREMEAAHVPQLPHFESDNQTCDLPRITKSTMIDILDGKYDHLYSKRVVIDCRFEYEYEGGHIDGAVNFNNKEELASRLFDFEPTANALLIFHCEYSAHRAPLMAKFIRNRDRTVNAERYPNLNYPEAYILDGGYSSFFKDHRQRCFPQNYVEMDAKEHERACELGLGKVKQRSKLTRAQTFACGQRSPGFDSSPTAMGRRAKDGDIDMDLGADFTPIAPRPTFDAMRGRPGRMASY